MERGWGITKQSDQAIKLFPKTISVLMGTCIYCLKESSSSRSVPHVAPECLVQNSGTLPVGAECDKCNNFFSGIESSFIHHNRIWTQIMLLRVPGKDGKKRKKMAYYACDDEAGILTAKIHDSWIVSDSRAPKIAFPPPKEYDESKFRRCLAHITLNYVAWKFGWESALDSKFDKLRNYAREGDRGKSWPFGQVMLEDSCPRRQLSLGLVEDAPGLTVKLGSFLDDFYFDAFASPELETWVGSLHEERVLYHDGRF